jgi:hypothetical protein
MTFVLTTLYFYGIITATNDVLLFLQENKLQSSTVPKFSLKRKQTFKSDKRKRKKKPTASKYWKL